MITYSVASNEAPMALFTARLVRAVDYANKLVAEGHLGITLQQMDTGYIVQVSQTMTVAEVEQLLRRTN